MDFLIDNQVDFQQDLSDGSYLATVKIVNQNVDGSIQPTVINGLDQMRELKKREMNLSSIQKKQQSTLDAPSMMLHNQI